VRYFTEDGGRPLEVGLQEQASNRHELHWSRAIVVNVDGKGGARLRQVRFKETNGSKPLMTCRNVSNDVETGTQISVPTTPGAIPAAAIVLRWHLNVLSCALEIALSVQDRADLPNAPDAIARAGHTLPLPNTHSSVMCSRVLTHIKPPFGRKFDVS
jgi:hypothetical protein